MARRRNSSSAVQGSLDSLLDTMTNVVGVLIMVLIVTQVNVSSAAKRIRANLPDISEAQMVELVKTDEEVRKRLEELRTPQDVKPEDLEKARMELRALLAARDRDRQVAMEVVDLEMEIETLQREIKAVQRQMEAEGGELAQIRDKLKKGEEDLVDQKPKLVRLPNPRVPEQDAKEVRLIVRGGRVLLFDRAAILDRIAAKVKLRKDLLSTAMKNRYDREKIGKFLETLKESDPDYRLEFVINPSGGIRMSCYPRDGRGDTAADLENPGAAGRRVIAQAFGDRNYIRFFVTADSFELYLAARAMAEKIQVPVGWVFADDALRQDLSLGERGITATPAEDYEPPVGKPPAPPKKKTPIQDILD